MYLKYIGCILKGRNRMILRYLMLLTLLVAARSVAATILFEENFDGYPDWAPISNSNVGALPGNWDYGYNDESWHPSAGYVGANPSMQINGNNPEQVYGGAGKAFISYSESDPNAVNGYSSDGFLTKDITPSNEVYVKFMLKFQPGYAANNETGTFKMFRVISWDGVDPRSRFFSSGNSAPMYLFNWKQDIYGVRNKSGFRCDDQRTNYYCTDPVIRGAPRAINTGDMSANFTSDISSLSPQLPNLVEGGVLPSSGLAYHNQLYGDIWHKMEFYIKLNSSLGAQDGQLRIWIDGRMILNMREIAWIGNGGDMNAKWNAIQIGGNDDFHFNDNSSAPIADRERWYSLDEILVLDRLPSSLSPPNPPNNILVQ